MATNEDPNPPPERIKRSNDPGWDYGQPVEPQSQRIKCDFCTHISFGGIKRHKEHLAGTCKDVKACKEVPADVKKLILDYILRNKEKKSTKAMARADMISRIDVYAGHEDDRDLPIEVEEVASAGNTEEVRRPNQSRKRKGPMDKWTSKSMEEGSFKTDGPKNASQQFARDTVVSYIADHIFESGSPFNDVLRPSFKKMCYALCNYADPKRFVPPSYHEIRHVYLKKKVESTRAWIDGFKVHWKTYGCTIMTDWWTDGKKRTLINFLVNCPKGTIFLKSLDGSDDVKDATLILNHIKEVLAEVGEENVIQVCTDNASNYKLAGKWLMEEYKIYWTPCAAHCVNLMLEDLTGLFWIQGVMKKCQQMTVFIYNHTNVLSFMKKHTGKRDLVRPSITRFATAFLSMNSIFEQKSKLRAMVATEEWQMSKWRRHTAGKIMYKTIKSSKFWNDLHYALKTMAPLVDVIRLVDREEQPCMGYMFTAMDIAVAKIKANIGMETLQDRERSKEVVRIVEQRWVDQLAHPLHAAGHYLNPSLYFATPTSPEEMESNGPVKRGLFDAIAKLAKDVTEEDLITRQLIDYRTTRGDMGRPIAKQQRNTLAPVEWWVNYGSEIPELQRFAKRVLGLTCSASPCERAWAVFTGLHSKKRNKLEHQKLNDLAYIQYNKRLRIRYEDRTSGKPTEDDPIVLDTVEEDCGSWLEPHDAATDIVPGTDFTYAVQESAEGPGSDDEATQRTRFYSRRGGRSGQRGGRSGQRGGRSSQRVDAGASSSRARTQPPDDTGSETDEDSDVRMTVQTDDEDSDDPLAVTGEDAEAADFGFFLP